MAETSASVSITPARRLLLPGVAPIVMGGCAWASVWVVVVLLGPSGIEVFEAGLLVSLIAAICAAGVTLLIAPQFLERSGFGWFSAALMGLIITLISFIPFGLLIATLMAVGGGMPVSAWEGLFFSMFLSTAGGIAVIGGGLSLPVTGPLGIAGGLICRALSTPFNATGGNDG